MEDKKAQGRAKAPSEDLFSASSDELLTTTQVALICGVSYGKFLRHYWDLPFRYLYPGGPRIYTRTEVRTFLEQRKGRVEGKDKL